MEMLGVVGCGGAGSRFARYVENETGIRSIRINDHGGDINVDRKLVYAYADVSPKIISQAFPWMMKLSFPYLFVVAGLGGLVGTSLVKLIGKGRRSSRLIGIFTLPFSSENRERRKRAMEAKEIIEKYYDIYFILDNDGLVNNYSYVPINVAMSIPAEVMKHIVLDFKRVIIKNFL
ncbi:MAG: cell division protein FtsZ, partial [Thermoplasmata archaeon]|nr:cell division protein FtsZ [Thermoplasmata archaeon]